MNSAGRWPRGRVSPLISQVACSCSQATTVFSASWDKVAGLCHARHLDRCDRSFSRFVSEVEAFRRLFCAAGPGATCWLAVATVTGQVTAFGPPFGIPVFL
jgi:hypothetical protein